MGLGGMIGGIGAGNALEKGANAALGASKEGYLRSVRMTAPYMTTGSAAQYKLGSLLGLYDDREMLRNSLTDTYNLAANSTGSVKDPKKKAEIQARVKAEMDRMYGSDDYGSLNDTFGADDFVKDPGYDFRLSEGQKSLDRAQASRGNFLSGAAVKASNRFNQDYASNEYQNAYNRFNNDQTNLFNRLSGVSGTGLSATGQQMNASNQYTGQQIDLLLQLANAKAAGKAALGSGIDSIAGNFASAYGGF